MSKILLHCYDFPIHCLSTCSPLTEKETLMAGLLGHTQAPRLQVVDFGPKKGRGVVALERISKGSYVCEYRTYRVYPVGSEEEAEMAREYKLNDEGSYVLQTAYSVPGVGARLCFDATRRYNDIGRLINHLVPFNLKVGPPFFLRDKWRVGLIAIRDVFVGQELTYDYGVRTEVWMKKREVSTGAGHHCLEQEQMTNSGEVSTCVHLDPHQGQEQLRKSREVSTGVGLRHTQMKSGETSVRQKQMKKSEEVGTGASLGQKQVKSGDITTGANLGQKQTKSGEVTIGARLGEKQMKSRIYTTGGQKSGEVSTGANLGQKQTKSGEVTMAARLGQKQMKSGRYTAGGQKSREVSTEANLGQMQTKSGEVSTGANLGQMLTKSGEVSTGANLGQKQMKMSGEISTDHSGAMKSS